MAKHLTVDQGDVGSRPTLAAITTDEAHRVYMNELSELVAKDPEVHTKDGQRLLELVELISEYEKKRWPI